jgi:hypothetical protein
MLVLGKSGLACVSGVSRAFMRGGDVRDPGGCQWICQCDSQFSSPLLGVAGVAAVASVAGQRGRRSIGGNTRHEGH